VQPVSPYAVTKFVNELYAGVFWKSYGVETIGLRYFNVFGPRQDPEGAYAAVIPRWIKAMIGNQPSFIYGDGCTSRDFCFVTNVVQANLLAACTGNAQAIGQVFNVAVNDRTTLVDLFEMIRCRLALQFAHLRDYRPAFRDFRNGDIRHSQADITQARKFLGYNPTHTLEQGLEETLAWHHRQRVKKEVQAI
jgi:UDP-N-acetylglucosamine/UDP-N-acetylgalactosamine 4-epimerase